MASSNQTAVFHLNQWEATDPVLREDFNTDNQKVEEALSTFAQDLEFLKPVAGTYTGTSSNTIGEQEIILGFTPSIVTLISARGKEDEMSVIFPDAPAYKARMMENGFVVVGQLNYLPTSSYGTGKNPYRYIAYR